MNVSDLPERNERGASAVEYGLLVAGIAALIVATVFLFGGFIGGSIDATCETLAAEARVNGQTPESC